MPDINKTADDQPDYRVLTQRTEIGAAWTKKYETSGKKFATLSCATHEFGPKKLYANLDKALTKTTNTSTR